MNIKKGTVSVISGFMAALMAFGPTSASAFENDSYAKDFVTVSSEESKVKSFFKNYGVDIATWGTVGITAFIALLGFGALGGYGLYKLISKLTSVDQIFHDIKKAETVEALDGVINGNVEGVGAYILICGNNKRYNPKEMPGKLKKLLNEPQKLVELNEKMKKIGIKVDNQNIISDNKMENNYKVLIGGYIRNNGVSSKDISELFGSGEGEIYILSALKKAYQAKLNELKKAEIKQEEVKQEEVKQEEVKQEEVKQEEVKQEEVKQ